jgi:tetratricopeptide (TPR) repeat protein
VLFRSAKGDTAGALQLIDSYKGKASEAELLVIGARGRELEGNPEKALECYSKALSRDPSNYSAAIGLARLLLSSRRTEECIAAADIAIGIDAREWEPHKLKAEAYVILGAESAAKFEMAQARNLLAKAGLKADDIVGG